MSSGGTWDVAEDAKTGRKYYYNKTTKETTWSKPAGFVEKTAAPAPKKAAVASAASSDPENDPACWGEGKDKTTGKTYYYNKKTRKTCWNRPACLGGNSGAGVWLMTVDKMSGKPYWYNKTTKETTWKNPNAAGEGAGAAASAGGAARTSRVGEGSSKSPAAATPAAATAAAAKPAASAGGFNMPTRAAAPSVTNINGALAHAPSEEDTPTVIPRSSSALGLDVSDDSDDDDAGSQGARKAAMHNRDVDQVRDAGDDSDDDDGGNGHDFTFAKHRHGWFNRTFRVGEVYDNKTILTFKKSLIRKALLKRNRHLDAEAIQAFKNVMSYMGDRKSRKKDPYDHAKKMIRNLMIAPVGLRDELYMQLCKQTNMNPTPTSTVKGWELMTFCLATFPPSKELKSFLMDYIKRNIKESDIADVRKLAKVCAERIGTIVLMGQRKQVPSKLELECLKVVRPVPIKVNLVDHTFRTFTVDPYTLNKDVEDMLVQKYSLVVREPFALYEAAAEANQERILDPKDRILDILASWENQPLIEEVKVEKHAVKQSKAFKHKDAGKVVKQKKVQYTHFLYKAKLVLKTSNKEIMSDPEAINLIYIQAVHDVVTARYPIKADDISVLAALQLQATFGDYNPDTHFAGWLKPKLEQFMPAHLLLHKGKKNEKLLKEWEQLILDRYAKVSEFTSLEAKINYLDYVQEWTFYGSTFFPVEQRQFKDYPSPITMGINCEGVILMHPAKQTVLENYGFTDIVTWGHSDEKFIIVVGNIVQQRKFIFKTIHGQAMHYLIHDYVKFKLKNKQAI